MKKISIVIPCFNEETNISHIVSAINDMISKLNYEFEIIFVDDGSKDNTVKAIKTQALLYNYIFYIEFSRNFGKDQALRAGLALAKGDAVITMDADMQHPPALLNDLINEWENGNEVVFTYRKENNPHVKWHQKICSKMFYKGLNFLGSVKLEEGISDFRLLDKKVVQTLNKIDEQEIFYRGMIKWIGFKQKGIPYTPYERLNGEVSYSFFKLTKLAINSILSFSVKPLLIASVLGVVFMFLSLLYIPYILFSYLTGEAVSGWTSIIATIVFFSSIQMLILGIMCVYISKLFMQNKQRPNFIISNTNYAQNDFVKL